MATNVFQELKRRKVVRLGVVYALVGFGIIEVAANTFQSLGVPEWGVTFVIALVILGFPLALVLSWIFDLTPEGIERTGPAEASATTAESRPGVDGATAVVERGGAADPRILDVPAETSQAESAPAVGEPAAAPPRPPYVHRRPPVHEHERLSRERVLHRRHD